MANYNFKIMSASIYGQCITHGIMNIMLSKSYIIERTNPMNAKDERYINKVSKMINEAKERARHDGINTGLSLYPKLVDVLIYIRDTITASFNEAFGEFSVHEILRIHSANYIVSTLKVWSIFYNDEFEESKLEQIQVIIDEFENN